MVSRINQNQKDVAGTLSWNVVDGLRGRSQKGNTWGKEGSAEGGIRRRGEWGRGQEGNAELSKIKVHDLHVKNAKPIILYN